MSKIAREVENRKSRVLGVLLEHDPQRTIRTAVIYVNDFRRPVGHCRERCLKPPKEVGKVVFLVKYCDDNRKRSSVIHRKLLIVRADYPLPRDSVDSK